MKNKIQLAASILFIATFFKGFFKILNISDVVILLCTTVVFLVYEFINNTKIEMELENLKKETDSKLFDMNKSLEEAKSYMSKVSANVAFGGRR